MTTITEAAKQLIEAAQRQRLERLRDIAQQRLLCRAKIQEANEIRERLARLDAEYARVEAQTAADIAREAMQAAQGAVILHPQPPGEVIEAPLTQPKPEPFRPGLPPERLRKVWAEWEMVDGVVYVFRGNKYRCAYRPPTEWWDIGAEHTWRASYRPHGKTWSEVEAMADAAEKPAEPKMLDLRELPVGTVCEAIASLPIPRRDLAFAAGQRFTIDGFDASALPVRALFDGSEWWLPALVPARVVKEGGEDAHR